MRSRVSNTDSSSGLVSSPSRPQEVIKLELTDGWYSVPAVLDSILTSFVRRGKIRVGSKLLLSNATLLGAEDGIDPLDSNYSSSRRDCPVALRLVANSTRLANWDAKLGFVPVVGKIRAQEGFLLVRSLSDIMPGGGNLPLMDLIICRQYPKLFLEQGGVNRVLSEAEDELCRKQFEKKRQVAIDKIMESAEKECSKEVEELAPHEWKKMMLSYSPSDYYEKLPKEGQRIVDNWKEKRAVMMQDMTRKWVDSTLQEDPSLTRTSIPFLRVFVKAYRTNSAGAQKKRASGNGAEPPMKNEGAILTIWRISEEQCNLIKEGNVIRVRNLAVKSTLHDGLLQLTANAKTQMQEHPSSPIQQQQLHFSGYKKRAHISMVRMHIFSKKRLTSSTSLPATGEVDIAGNILKFEKKRRGLSEVVMVYMSDESGLILRLEKEVEDADDDFLYPQLSKVVQEGGNDVVIAFHDVSILRFDVEENTAVAAWTRSSSFHIKNGSPRLRSLQSWCESSAGKMLRSNLATAFRAGIPITNKYPSDQALAIGYILCFKKKDFSSPSCPSDVPHHSIFSSVQVLIDCGSHIPINAEFPLYLLEQLLRLWNQDKSKTVDSMSSSMLVENEGSRDCSDFDFGPDQIDTTLDELTKVCRQYGILFHFVLRKKTPARIFLGKPGVEANQSFEVKQIKKANICALSTLYMANSTNGIMKN